MDKFAVAVKALITNELQKEETILVLKNALDDPFRPGETDFPGGRLNPGEDPYLGLKRELEEELGQEFSEAIIIGWPIDIAHFERPDGQVVTMIFFHCHLKEDKKIILSAEHSSYEWLPTEEAGKVIKGKMKRAYNRLQNPSWCSFGWG